jgi:hypothetical protein
MNINQNDNEKNLSNTKYIFSKWNKLNVTNFLLSDEITIYDKINIFDNFLKWQYNLIVSNNNTNQDMYPFINLFLTYIYIKEKLNVEDIESCLSYEINFKDQINSITNIKILSMLTLYGFTTRTLKEINFLNHS